MIMTASYIHEENSTQKPMEENRMSSISKADSDEKIGEFWDSHDFTEFDTDAPDADFEVISTVPVQLELLNEIES